MLLRDKTTLSRVNKTTERGTENELRSYSDAHEQKLMIIYSTSIPRARVLPYNNNNDNNYNNYNYNRYYVKMASHAYCTLMT